MEHSTQQDESNPSIATLEIIRQIAHTYRTLQLSNGGVVAYCLN